MKPAYFWKDTNNNDIYIDLEKEDVHFIAVLWATATGKSEFNKIFYKYLIDHNAPDEIWFIFIDFSQVDYIDLKPWRYLIMDTEYQTESAFITLEKLWKPTKKDKKKIFVHIEGSTAHIEYPERFKSCIDNILKNNPNVCLVYTTSRLFPKMFDEYMDKIDIKIVFATYYDEQSFYYLWNDSANQLKQLIWQRILAYDNKQILCNWFDKSDLVPYEDFEKIFK